MKLAIEMLDLQARMFVQANSKNAKPKPFVQVRRPGEQAEEPRKFTLTDLAAMGGVRYAPD